LPYCLASRVRVEIAYLKKKAAYAAF